MFKFVHWIVVSRSQLLVDLLSSTWPRDLLVRLTQSSSEDIQAGNIANNASLIVIDLATIDVQAAYQLQKFLEKSKPAIRVVFLHLPVSVDTRFLLQCSNVAGVFPTSASLDDMSAGLKEIINGVVVIPPEVLKSVQECELLYDNEGLTFREREVLKALLSGSTNLDIANKLFVSESTIKTHLYRAFRKIGVSSRGQAIAWAQRNIHEVHV